MNEPFFVSKSVIDETLAVSPIQGKKLLEPLKALALAHKLPFNILEDHEVTTNDAEVHKHEADLWHCLEGEVEFTYGGELVNGEMRKKPDGTHNENEWKAPSIMGGTKVVMRPGDWLWIPAGVAHQHQAPKTARIVIIKIPKAE